MENSKRNRVIYISKIVLNVIFYLFIIILLLFSFATMQVKNNDDIPSIFGTGFLSVASSSMEGNQEDSFNKGDLIFVDILNDKERANLKVGDIVTYYDPELRALNTHRIVEVGSNYLITQGDKVAMDPDRKYNPNSNTNDATAYETIDFDEALALHTSTWKNAGNTLAKLQTPSGFALFIIVPTMIIFAAEGFFLVRNIININKAKLEAKLEKDKEEAKKDLEKEKELIRAQLLEEMRKEQELKENK